MLFSEILDGNDMTDQIAFFTHWTLNNLLYMARRIAFLEDDETSLSVVDRIETLKTATQLYETVYKNDDMSFEALRLLSLIHMQIAKMEIQEENREAVVRKHLERAYECSSKSATITEHKLTLPLLFDWEIQSAPSDNLCIIKWFQTELKKDYFREYSTTKWLMDLQQKNIK